MNCKCDYCKHSFISNRGYLSCIKSELCIDNSLFEVVNVDCGTCLNSYLDAGTMRIVCDKEVVCNGKYYEPINESFDKLEALFKMLNSEDKVKTKNKMTVDQSTYRKNILDKMDRQIQKGIDKYGTTLEQNDWLKAIDRIVYLQEELIDALVYSEHIITKLKELNIDLD